MNEVSWHDPNIKLGDSSPKPPGIDGAALEALAEGAEDAAEGGQMKMIQNLTGFCCRCVCFFKGAEMLVYGNIQGFCCCCCCCCLQGFFEGCVEHFEALRED